MISRDELTVIYYTANTIGEGFAGKVREVLSRAIGKYPLISVSQKRLAFGENVCVGPIGQTVFNLYRQVLAGARLAQTPYVAMAEDDTLYPSDHFEIRPADDCFAYDMNRWSLFTWSNPPIFSRRHRKVLSSMIAPRKLLIEALEERFAKYPDDSKIPIKYFAEPGRYETGLKVKVQKTEEFFSTTPMVSFTHPESLGYQIHGVRKSLGNDRAYQLPYWGTAEEISRFYSL